MLTSAKLRGPRHYKVYFLKLLMGVYLHAKFEVYSIVLTSLIQEEGVVLPPSPSPLPPQNEALKSPPRLGLKKTTNWSKYQSDTKIYAQNQYLNQLVD